MRIVATIEGAQVTSATHARRNPAADALRSRQSTPTFEFKAATVEGGN